MENFNFWIILLQIIIAALWLYLVNYVKKKANNQADKEDLKKLTEIVEEVKRKNSEEMEFLKANLDIISSKEKEIFNEEKLAVIEFYTQLHKWIWSSLNIYLNDFNYFNYENIDGKIEEIRNSYQNVQISFGKVQLFVDDKDLIDKGNQLIKKSLDLHHFVEDKLNRLKQTLGWGKSLTDQIKEIGTGFKNLAQEMKEFYQSEARKNTAEKDAILDEFYAGHSEKWKVVLDELVDFRIKVRERFKK